MVIEKSLGNYLQNLRKERKLSLKDVADHIGIDISMLSKIEHGERQLQSHMLKGISEIFELDYRKLQIDYLSSRIKNEFGEEPFLKEVVLELSKELK
jgi:transcriptional regulator with XRE-family HTH domain